MIPSKTIRKVLTKKGKDDTIKYLIKNHGYKKNEAIKVIKELNEAK